MKTISAPTLTQTKPKSQIYAKEILNSFRYYADTIKILSLDCFDTLLWRKTAEPKDVFHDLDQRPAFKTFDVSARMRIEGEGLAYKKNRVRSGVTQANLTDIYRAIFPQSNEEQIHTLVEEELAAEMETCYVFPPLVELIREAFSRDIKIIIVSDTYLKESQLRCLLASKLPRDVMAMISKIYCSCDMGRSKAEGIFSLILHQLQVPPQRILHLGDNSIADFDSPTRLGIHALNLIHHADSIGEILRMHGVAASFLDPTIRNTRSLPSPFRGLMAAQMNSNSPESIIGYAAIGPIMYAFARFICDEVEQMLLAGKRPKVLFLLRDAYLPSLVCETLADKSIGTCVRISRFSAVASAFRTKADVENYLAANAESLRFRDMCCQLLVPENMTESILKKIESIQNPVVEFAKLILDLDVLSTIYLKSKEYRSRLRKYLEKEVGLEAGDTLVFVDLGYTCTTQIMLEPIFREEMNIEVVGRYLITVRTPNWRHSRRGLIDSFSHDDKALGMLIHYIPVFEKLCSSTEKSVINFDNDGNPIYSDIDVKEKQHSNLKLVQSECIRFVREVEAFCTRANLQISNQMLRDVAGISLARLIFFPTKEELSFLKNFQCEINMGTKEVLPIFDLDRGLTSLRRRGWLNGTKENVKNMRLNYPAEWHHANFELSLTLMSQLRFDFDVAINDLSQRRENLDVIYATQPDKNSVLSLEARPTHDGYFSLLIPVVNGNQFGICFGKVYQWVELESAELIKLAHLYARSEFENTVDSSANLIVDQMQDKGGGLFECLSDSGLLIYTPPVLSKDNYALRIIFRPIVKRSS